MGPPHLADARTRAPPPPTAPPPPPPLPPPVPPHIEDLVFSMPCRSDGDGDYEIIDDFMVDDWLRMKLKVCAVRCAAQCAACLCG